MYVSFGSPNYLAFTGDITPPFTHSLIKDGKSLSSQILDNNLSICYYYVEMMFSYGFLGDGLGSS